MKQKGIIVRLFLTFALIVLTGISLSANGLNLNGVGSKAIAMGGAFIGQADDYSAVFWNPAGLTQLKDCQLVLFGTDIIPSLTYKFSLAGIDAKSKSKMYPSGALGYFKPVNDKLVIGLFGYVPSGTGATWDGNDLMALSAGKALEWESMIGVITIAPVVAYKITDTFSLGATVNINYGMMTLKRPAVVKLGPLTLADQYDEKTHAWGIGATIGMLFKPTEKLGIGLSFRQQRFGPPARACRLFRNRARGHLADVDRVRPLLQSHRQADRQCRRPVHQLEENRYHSSQVHQCPVAGSTCRKERADPQLG
jgi:long-chain fatty acid transport protein